MQKPQQSQSHIGRRIEQYRVELAQCNKCSRQIPLDMLSIHEQVCNPQENLSEWQKEEEEAKELYEAIPAFSVRNYLKQFLKPFQKEEEILPQPDQLIQNMEQMVVDQGSMGDSGIVLIPCQVCGQMYLIEGLQDHQQSCKIQPYQKCQFCMEQFPADTLKEHLSLCPIKKDLQRETELFNKPKEVIFRNRNPSVQKQKKPVAIQYKSRVSLSRFGEVKVQRAIRKQIECSICFGPIRGLQKVYDLKCSHKFHEKCLDPWLKSNSRCPMCKQTVQTK